MLYVIATLRVRPEKRATCIAAARKVIAETRKEEGCIFYDMHQSVTDPDQIVFVERWASTDALGNHFKAPHMEAWRNVGKECFVDRKVEIISPEHVEAR
jgi:quinol monooxygenase YgiN